MLPFLKKIFELYLYLCFLSAILSQLSVLVQKPSQKVYQLSKLKESHYIESKTKVKCSNFQDFFLTYPYLESHYIESKWAIFRYFSRRGSLSVKIFSLYADLTIRNLTIRNQYCTVFKFILHFAFIEQIKRKKPSKQSKIKH